jgi:DNA-binding response OmpR family regulator
LVSQGTKRRILVVDDEQDITISLQVGLEDGGLDVDAFTDPELALSSFKAELYDLVLIDIISTDDLIREINNKIGST